MVARDLVIRVLTMTGGLVLAILLGPAAFGVWAVGLGLIAALQAVTRSGLGARCSVAPRRRRRAS